MFAKKNESFRGGLLPAMRAVGQFLGLLGLTLGMAQPVHADIFRHVDRDGVIHFSNRPSKGKGWQRVLKTSRRRSRPRSAVSRPPASTTGVEVSASERFLNYQAHIAEASGLYQLPVELIRAVMTVESNFHPYVVSYVGAMGLMQLMPATAARMGVSDPFDPRQNVLGGARYLRILANQFNGDIVLTLAAYNAGENAVLKYGGVPPYAETRRYVKRVLMHYYNLRAKGRSSSQIVAQR